VNTARTLVRTLTLPYESVRTLYEGDHEVRLYRNELTGLLQVGKRIDLLGLEESVALTHEGRLLQEIKHRHVTPIIDVALVSGFPQPMNVVELIMPFYEEGSLYDSFLAHKRYGIADAVRLTGEVLLGLNELHEVHGVLHRDVKTPNVFLGGDGHALLGDLGVAVSMRSGGTAEALRNARLYATPEALTVGRATRQSDIFQCGIVLHELASGPLSYEHADFAIDAIAERLSKGERPIPDNHLAHHPCVPKGLRAVIKKATAVDPSRRYGSATAMHAALSRLRYVSWEVVSHDPERTRWEGRVSGRPGRAFAVDAIRRTNGWHLRGEQRVNAWRQVRPPAIVQDPMCAAACEFFDSMVAIATNR
jgi:serine/threonine protein kinase